jgi:hypothetical protein
MQVRYIQDGVIETIDLEDEEWRLAPNPDGETPTAPVAAASSKPAGRLSLKGGKPSLKLRLRIEAKEAFIIPAPPPEPAARGGGGAAGSAAAALTSMPGVSRLPPGMWPKVEAKQLVEYSLPDVGFAGSWFFGFVGGFKDRNKLVRVLPLPAAKDVLATARDIVKAADTYREEVPIGFFGSPNLSLNRNRNLEPSQ